MICKPNRYHAAACAPLNAITWALDFCPDAEVRTFLADWRMGDFGEWADYIEFVRAMSSRGSAQ